MMAQSLDFGSAERAAQDYRRMVRAVDDAVAAMGLDVAAGATGIAKSDLRGMLDGRNGRRLPWSALLAAQLAEQRRRNAEDVAALQRLVASGALTRAAVEQPAREVRS